MGTLRTKLRVQRRIRELSGWRSGGDMPAMVPFYKRLWGEAARVLGAEMTELAPDIWEFRLDGARTVINNFKVPLDDPVVLHMAGDKALGFRLLQDKGLAVPEHAAIQAQEHDRAAAFMEKFPGKCFVVKPARGTSGSAGVSTHVMTRWQCRKALAVASLSCPQVLIERQVVGEAYRLLVLDGRVIHATRRQGFWVRGDGRSSLKELIQGALQDKSFEQVKDKRPVKGTAFRASDKLIRLDCICQGMSLNQVPKDGRRVLVRQHISPGQGSREQRTVFNEDVTGEICLDLERQAILAAEALGSQFAGIDLITTDPGVSLEESGGAVIEVNTTPGLHHHYNLINPGKEYPAVSVLRYLLNVYQKAAPRQ